MDMDNLERIIIAVVVAVPPTAASILSYFSSRRNAAKIDANTEVTKQSANVIGTRMAAGTQVMVGQNEQLIKTLDSVQKQTNGDQTRAIGAAVADAVTTMLEAHDKTIAVNTDRITRHAKANAEQVALLRYELVELTKLILAQKP